MVKPIKHDGSSEISTVGWSTLKGSLLGLLVVAAIGAVSVGAIAVLGGAGLAGVKGAVFGGFGAGGAQTWGLTGFGQAAAEGAKYMLSGPGAVFTGIAALGGAIYGGVSGSVIGLLGGGALGMFSGSKRVQAENAAYNEVMEGHSQNRQQRIARLRNDAEIKGVQQGYVLGFQEGQNKIIHDIQEYQAHLAQQEGQQAQPQAAPQAPANTMASAEAPTVATAAESGFSAKFTKECKTKAEIVAAERAEPAQAGISA